MSVERVMISLVSFQKNKQIRLTAQGYVSQVFKYSVRRSNAQRVIKYAPPTYYLSTFVGCGRDLMTSGLFFMFENFDIISLCLKLKNNSQQLLS